VTGKPGFLQVLVLACLLQAQALGEVRDVTALNVSISVFDAGVPDDRSLHRDLQIFPRIREVEAKFLPFVLREALVGTGEWGAVRVVTEPDSAAEVEISGSIIRSDGEILEIRVRALDATGREWFDRVFASGLTRDGEEGGAVDDSGQPGLYDEIAESLRAARDRLDDRALGRIVETSLLRYATELAPSAFDEYLTEDEDGIFSIERLDSVDAKFRELHEEIASTYALWREYRYKSLEYDRQNARRAEETRSDASRGSYEAIKDLYDNYKWDRVTAQEQDRLAIAFDNEVSPVVEAMEARIVELEGWVDDKYAEWRKLLEELFEVESELNRAML
jgi:hypothetical protein